MHKESIVSIGAGLVLALACAADAHAVDLSRITYTNPTAVCQGALPAFDGLIRKRPLAVQNEGTSPAFVTCSYPSQGRITVLNQWVNTGAGTQLTISCTAVTSYATGSNVFVTKSVTVGPGTNQANLSWVPADFGGTTTFPSNFINLSCNLPPGAALNDAYLFSLQDVGL